MNESTTNTTMRDHCIENGIIDNSPYISIRIYKVSFPRPIIYVFNQMGLMHFCSADDFDRKYGKYESANRREIFKCDSLIFDEHQNEPMRVIQFFVEPAAHHLSINRNSLLILMMHHWITMSDARFEVKHLRMFFERQTNSINEAERWVDVFHHLMLGTSLEEIDDSEQRTLVARERDLTPMLWTFF